MKLDMFFDHKSSKWDQKWGRFWERRGLKSDKFWAKLASEKHQKHVKTKSTSESWNTFYGEGRSGKVFYETSSSTPDPW